MPHPTSSLVRYEPPILTSLASTSHSATSASATPPSTDVLHSLLPPRHFQSGGRRWTQYVSTTPATRQDVLNLQVQLDKRLAGDWGGAGGGFGGEYELEAEGEGATHGGKSHSGKPARPDDATRNSQGSPPRPARAGFPPATVGTAARETGVCPIREALYAEAFDELIRQVTVHCTERGVLLLRVRDEMRMTLEAYRTLYESSVAFGVRKALKAEESRVGLQEEIRSLERENEELARKVEELKTKCELVERREEERRAADERKHAEEMSALRKTHQTLTVNLQSIINPMKK